MKKLKLIICIAVVIAAICLFFSSCDDRDKRVPAVRTKTVMAPMWSCSVSQVLQVDSVTNDTVVDVYYVYAEDKYDADRVLNDSVLSKVNRAYESYTIKEVITANKPVFMTVVVK